MQTIIFIDFKTDNQQKMISKKDKLLLRPWLEKRYENHKRKVRSATPAIDNKTPKSRTHVEIKRKLLQKENERSSKIEKDNLLLLKKLNSIMKSNRVDNNWLAPLPNFLNRVNIYENKRPKTAITKTSTSIEEKLNQNKIKCFACCPEKHYEIPKVPEERVPWAPPKPPYSLKYRSQSVPPKKRQSSNTAPVKTIEREKSKSAPATRKDSGPVLKVSVKNKSNQNVATDEKIKLETEKKKGNGESELNINAKSLKNLTNSKIKSFELECEKNYNQIVLCRAGLVLSVNFPSDTSVKIKNGQREKQLIKSFCKCKKFG